MQKLQQGCPPDAAEERVMSESALPVLSSTSGVATGNDLS